MIVDLSHVVFACLPKCLQNGSNPNTISGDMVSFPLYNGPESIIEVSGHMHGSAVYFDGKLDCSFDNSSVVTNYIPIVTSANKFTYHMVVDLPDKDPHTGDFVAANYNDIYYNDFISFEYNNDIRYFFDNPYGNVSFFMSIYSETLGNNVFMILSDNYPTEGRHAFTVVKNGINIKIYIDGINCPLIVDEYFGFTDTYSLGDLNTVDPITIGSVSQDFDTSSVYGFRNNVYQFIVFDNALSDSEILNLYNLGSDLGGLKCHYQLVIQ